jgi:uncharacterized protein
MEILQPIDPGRRIEVLDVLRGFALLGILFNNILYFSGYSFQPLDELRKNPTFQLDEKLFSFLDIVITAKFYTLFSILFAVGFYLQLNRHTNDSSDFMKTYRRRLFILLLIGVLHSLFWNGDILLMYSLLGFILLWFRNMKKEKLIRFAIFFIFLPAIIDLVLLPFTHASGVIQPKLAHTTYPDMTPAAVMSIFKNGSVSEIFYLNIHHLIWKWLSYIPSGRMITMFGIFVLGYYLGSINFFEDKIKSTKLLVLGLVVGLSTTVIAVTMGGNPYQFPPTLLNIAYKSLLDVGQISMCLFYVASIARLLHTTSGHKFLCYLRPVGRMALTNYLFQSLICVFIFYNFGMNLFGEMGLVYVDCIAISVLIFQVILSNLWLNYFKFGPLEWVWRSLTYRKRIMIRL